MSVHIIYISLLVLSFGFVVYLKYELDGLEKNYAKDSVVLERKYTGLVESESRLKKELQSCKNDRDNLKKSLGSESKSLEESLSEHKRLLKKCDEEKTAAVASVSEMSKAHTGHSEQLNVIKEQANQCEGQKQQLQAQLNDQASGQQGCEVKRQQCEGDKVNYFNELQVLKQQAGCEEEKRRSEELSANLQSCQQTSGQLEAEKNTNFEGFNLCSGQLHGCEQEKNDCATQLASLQQQQQQQEQQRQQQEQQRQQQEQQQQEQQRQQQEQQRQQQEQQRQQQEQQQQEQQKQQQQQQPPQQ